MERIAIVTLRRFERVLQLSAQRGRGRRLHVFRGFPDDEVALFRREPHNGRCSHTFRTLRWNRRGRAGQHLHSRIQLRESGVRNHSGDEEQQESDELPAAHVHLTKDYHRSTRNHCEDASILSRYRETSFVTSRYGIAHASSLFASAKLPVSNRETAL